MSDQLRRLNWSCGDLRLPGWINVAHRNAPGFDICCNVIVDGLPLERNSMSCVGSSHALQQFDAYEILGVLRELHRVLAPGGVVRLCLPDFDKAIACYLNKEDSFLWCHEWETRSGNLMTQIMNYGHDRTLFTYEFLEELLSKAKFVNVRRVAYHRTNGADPKIVELDRRPDESLYVEALKQNDAEAYEIALPGTPSQIHLSWAEDPSRSLTVGWHTASESNPAIVEYRESGHDTWNRMTGVTRSYLGKGKLHKATLTGLRRDTNYEYRVSSDTGAIPAMSDIFQTRTAPAPGTTEYRFAFLCDTGLAGRPDGNGTGIEQIIHEILADQPLFILGGGDYAYANRDARYRHVEDAIDAWLVQMQPLLARFPFLAQYGNHEIFLEEKFRDWAPRFAHPPGFDQGKNYSFDVGDAHFTALFVPGGVPSVEQLAWLDTDLESARKRGMRWLVVYQHMPIYAHGHSHPADPKIRKVLAPVFEKHRVDLHLSGHDQNYERTYPLIGVPEAPTPTSTSPDRYQAGKGVIYAKVSPSGKMSEIRNDFSRFTTEQQPFIAVRDDTAHHYALVTVKAERELQIEVYSVKGDGRPKTLLDAFRIIASEGGSEKGGGNL